MEETILPEPIYREETPTQEDLIEELTEFQLPIELQPGQDVWQQKEPTWSQNIEIDDALSCLNADMRTHINQTHDHLVDLMDIKNTKLAERIQVKLNTNMLEVKDETDKLNYRMMNIENRFTQMSNNVSILGDKVTDVSGSLESIQESMKTQNEATKVQNDSLVAAVGALTTLVQSMHDEKVTKAPSATSPEAKPVEVRPKATGNVRTSRGDYPASGHISDEETPAKDRRASLYETMGTPRPRVNPRVSDSGILPKSDAPIIHYLREPDKDDNFKMKSLSVDSAVRLVDHRQRIHRETGFVRPMINYMTIEVQEDLIANGGFSDAEARKLRFGGLARYTDEEMLALIQQAVCNMHIHAPSDFIRHLRAQKFPNLPEDFKAMTSNFKILSSAIGRYCVQYVTRYDFLVSKCDMSCIPALFKTRNVTDSIVTVFLENIPHGLGKRINTRIPAEDLKGSDDLGNYLSLFQSQVSTLQKASLASLNLYEILKDPKDDTQATSRQTSQTQHTKKLMFSKIHDEDDEYSSNAEMERGVYALAQPYNREGGFKTKLKSGDTRNTSDREKPPGGCLNHVLGDCPLGVDCRYAHAPEERMQKTWQYYVTKLGKSKYASTHKETMELLFPKAAVAPSPTQNTYVDEEEGHSRDNRHSSADDLLSEDTDFSQDLLAALGSGKQISSRVHKQGTIRLETGDTLPLNRVLFDSGALHSSYINSDIVDKNRTELAPFLVANPGKVRLGDNRTLVEVKENLVIPIAFMHEGKEFSAEVSFIVWAMPGLDAIIGLPDIIKSFCDAFISMIKSDKLEPSEMHILDGSDQLISPWAFEADDEAPEEVATDLPCSFSGPLHYLSMSREDAIQEYKEQLSTHVEKSFADTTTVLELLNSELAIDVFIPSVWNGIVGVPDLELDFKDTLPTSMRPRARPVNPRLYENAHKEFSRLCTYFYTPADSAIASPLVIAPKATKPFIRFCGDYVEVNKHITIPHYPIPKVVHALEKAAGYKVFLDIDMTNSFHQIKLGTRTSNILSVQTPWGLVRPLYMPEGIGPASGILQRTVMEIFDDYQDFMINIFDNLLVLCHDYDDALKKLRIVLERARDRGVVFKFSKSWLGFGTVTFFGYEVSHGCYRMSQARKDAIAQVVMPKGQKEMQRFLGAALFFKSFIPEYSQLTASCYAMTRDGFNWDPESWDKDYITDFINIKLALQVACTIYFPNYDLQWILRVDASDVAVGAVLIQVLEDGVHKGEHQPIAFSSQKFSDQAGKWDIFKKEAYAVYYGVKTFSYYLHGKPIVLETDHKNLLWIEKSTVPIVIRWRVYLQSFQLWLRSISGKSNVVADWMSRMYSLELEDQINPHVDEIPAAKKPEYYLEQVHGGRQLHKGARRTWLALNKYFPGHNIPYRIVEEFVTSCPRCQKDRLGMTNNLTGVVRHIKPAHQRSRIGVDRLAVTPADESGNTNLVVMVEHHTKYVSAYPTKDYTAMGVAKIFFHHFCVFGLFDEIWSDPGSDFMSDVISQLNTWFGIRHVVSLVDRHESNGVEGTNKQLLRHLRALCNDEALKSKWSDPTVLSLILFTINDAVNSESGVRPFDAKYGSDSGTYFRLPENTVSSTVSHIWLQQLNQDLQHIRKLTNEHHAHLVKERTALNPPVEKQNHYQPGDFILYQYPTDRAKPSKLSSPYLGPYEVRRHVKNDIEASHVVTGGIQTFHVDQVKLFVGNRVQAEEVGRSDADQHMIHRFLAYIGDPYKRTTCEFEVEFCDGSIVWLPWSNDIFSTTQYEYFCRDNRELFPLLFTVETARLRIKEIRTQSIDLVAPGETVYLSLRNIDPYWYDTLPLEDPYHLLYVVVLQYISWSVPRSAKHIRGHIPVFALDLPKLDNYFVSMCGCTHELRSSMILLDALYFQGHPSHIPPSTSLAQLHKKP